MSLLVTATIIISNILVSVTMQSLYRSSLFVLFHLSISKDAQYIINTIIQRDDNLYDSELIPLIKHRKIGDTVYIIINITDIIFNTVCAIVSFLYVFVFLYFVIYISLLLFISFCISFFMITGFICILIIANINVIIVPKYVGALS